MFEDLEDEDVDITPDSPDRLIVYAAWSKSETASITPEEAWLILYERYPDDPRFLLLHVYSEVADGSVSSVWTTGYFLSKIERIAAVADEPLFGPLRDLLAFTGNMLAKASGDEQKRVAAVRAQVGAEGDVPTKRDERAGLRLRRFEREVVRELHDRTEDGKALGTPSVRAIAAAPAHDELEKALADPSRARKRYSATERFAKGDLLEHPKFGVGLVVGVEPGRANILFESGARKLVMG